MAKTLKTEKPRKALHPEVKGLILLISALVCLLSLLTFKNGSPSSNWLGLIGYITGWSITYLCGIGSYLLLLYAAWAGWKLLCHQEIPGGKARTIYFALFLTSFCMLLNFFAELGAPLPAWILGKIYSQSISIPLPSPHIYLRHNLGGVPLYYLYRDIPTFNLEHLLGSIGIGIVFSTTTIVFFLLWTEIQVLPLLISLKQFLEKQTNKEEMPLPQEEFETALSTPQPIYAPTVPTAPKIRTLNEGRKEKEKDEASSLPPPSKRERAIVAQKVYNGDFTAYTLPPPSLLKNPKKTDQPTLKKDLRRQAEILEETLLSFGIEAKVGEIYCGPTITSFEVHPAVGVKVQKITALENDIALKLQAKSIRIIAPIPGKAAVGVEIPSLYPQEVSFKEMLLSYQQSPRKLHVPILLGKTVSGEDVMSDLSKMPHCIIAGATGSGKSVCINTIILSILMNARPDEIKLLMIDPKKVELTPYTTLPHMIAPVITEAHGAYAALSWLVKEMQTRYDILKHLGVRNISAFNTRQINKELEASLSVPVPARMHTIVAIIDEFADLMMVSSSDLETPIARIAQMARAVGIHLILATQRPSREVITGLIKANFPTRIAFKVASRINSQIILDETGAESLLGNGDLLFLPPGSSHLIRAQGAYVSDEEINQIVSFICEQSPPNYLISSFDTMTKEIVNASGGGGEESGRDQLYDEARSIVLETQCASTTFLQRKLKIGYARAASLMDELETKGIIGPQEGAKPRRILAKTSSSKKDEEGDE